MEKPRLTPRQAITCSEDCEALFIRVDGRVLCETCHKPYYDHPYCAGQISTIGGDPQYYIHVACDGRHLKL